MKKISCIIALYNEGERILGVLDELFKVKELTEIIVVDDASSVDNSSRLRERYPNLKLLRFEKNHGKAGAIKLGLNIATSENILLFDADLFDMNLAELKVAIKYFLNHREIDMIILRRMYDNFFSKIIRTDVVNSGQRLLRTKDLKAIYQMKFRNFELEMAINDYMLINHKIVGWLPFSCNDIRKVQKFGLINGTIRELKMTFELFNYKGIVYFFRTLFTFARKKFD